MMEKSKVLRAEAVCIIYTMISEYTFDDSIIPNKEENTMAKADPKLLEMAEVFRIPKEAKLKYIILPAVLPGVSKMLSERDALKREKSRSVAQGGETK